MDQVKHSDVQRWIAQVSSECSPATVKKVHRVLAMLLSLAVRDGRLRKNPADNIALPRVVHVVHVGTYRMSRSNSWRLLQALPR